MNSSKIAKLQFITPPQLNVADLYTLSKQLLDYGLKWIQLRRKFENNSIEDYNKRSLIQEAKALKVLCEQYDAQLIINDYVWLCQEIEANGIHLGRNDLSIKSARQILGQTCIIGTSSNSLCELNEAYDWGANYSGLGPIYATSTKKDHNPVLGWEKSAEIITNFKQDLPVVLIGGISESDLPLHSIFEKCGIALSSALSDAKTFSKYKKYLNSF